MDEIGRLRDDALAMITDAECRTLLAAATHGEDAARRAYVRARDLVPMRQWHTRRGREAWITAMVLRLAFVDAVLPVDVTDEIARLRAEAA